MDRLVFSRPVVRSSALLAVLMAGVLPLSARAGVCDAPWMHDGGEIRLAVPGAAGIHATINVAEVKKDGPGSCRAEVTTLASASRIGVSNETRTAYRVEVKADRAKVIKHEADGQLAARAGNATAAGSVSAKGLETLSYTGLITGAGQRLPGESYELSMDAQTATSGMPAGQVKMPSAKVTSSEKVVGERTALETRIGRLMCWPVRYERITRAGSITVAGHTMLPPASTAKMTDWYCPDVALVMKQESVQGGQAGVVEVVSVK